ncbi:uncharacterized protein F5891DRAFT_984027 [Suillus fuscotomentosus]|uniref:Uncharacterized protein n=1 Tax=Suillus fuscotomentosus TaxID=1912939 RepID=A0AAD4HFH7_9AGAM|nr:uncharacterized protein F5891DRAFT_984027 [Suillus fuscotomentosus]KAG1895725.1 hypothetical protein F5891DRAFT_984027 [Suillus fuscotomentosus]
MTSEESYQLLKMRRDTLLYLMAVQPKVATPPSCKYNCYVEVTTKNEMNIDEECIIKVTLKMGAKKITNLAGAVLMEDDFADTSAPTWAPHYGQCVACDVICHQGYNKNNGQMLKVCGLCSHLKIQCGGKGSSALPAKGKSVAACRAHSQSWCHPSLMPVIEDPAPDTGPLVEEEPAHPATPAVPNPEPSQMENPEATGSSSSILLPSCVTHQEEIQALKTEVTSFCATIEALLSQVLAATPTDLTTNESDKLAAGPANDMKESVCLLVALKTPEPEPEESQACVAGIDWANSIDLACISPPLIPEYTAVAHQYAGYHLYEPMHMKGFSGPTC